MIETAINFLQHKVPDEWIVFIISMLPVLELRGGLIAASVLKIDWLIAFPLCVIGNMLPIPLELLFIRKIFNWLKRFGPLKRLVERMDRRATQKANSPRMKQYADWGLFVLVAIPIPGTGAWTGGLVADIMDFRIKRAFPIILFGVITAGLIMSFFSYVIDWAQIGQWFARLF